MLSKEEFIARFNELIKEEYLLVPEDDDLNDLLYCNYMRRIRWGDAYRFPAYATKSGKEEYIK
jgi:hypothetical protein